MTLSATLSFSVPRRILQDACLIQIGERHIAGWQWDRPLILRSVPMDRRRNNAVRPLTTEFSVLELNDAARTVSACRLNLRQFTPEVHVPSSGGSYRGEHFCKLWIVPLPHLIRII